MLAAARGHGASAIARRSARGASSRGSSSWSIAGSPRQELDALDGALTTCAAACAETGTIALDGGPGQGRRALSLVPDLHVCVVRAAAIVETVPELIERLEPGARAGRPIVLVSGPSATSDIELNRVEGVHGPRRLVVIVADLTIVPTLCAHGTWRSLVARSLWEREVASSNLAAPTAG